MCPHACYAIPRLSNERKSQDSQSVKRIEDGLALLANALAPLVLSLFGPLNCILFLLSQLYNIYLRNLRHLAFFHIRESQHLEALDRRDGHNVVVARLGCE